MPRNICVEASIWSDTEVEPDAEYDEEFVINVAAPSRPRVVLEGAQHLRVSIVLS